MRKKILLLFFIGFLFLSSGLLWADCLDLSEYTGWDLKDAHTITFYRGNRSLAVLQIPDCTIQTSSRVRLIQNFVCGGDKIEIDGQTCSIQDVQVAE